MTVPTTRSTPSDIHRNPNTPPNRYCMKNVLFFSTGESARAYLATAIFNSLRAPALVKAVCASQEAGAPQPEVAAALKEIGIDPSDLKSQRLRPDEGAEINLVVTFGG